ncbi:MAG: GNAT family N-acetyltransferase [Clostridia bacterium]|nr:GNAT family N-acetyltransferase [Clostridia bacterium]
MEHVIREMKTNDYFLLDDFLYNAIFIPKGINPPPKSIIQQEELQVYVKDFGKLKDDVALVAETNGKIIGAVWARIMNDYGHIDNDTPSLAISLYKDYRGYGIGTDLMQNMLSLLKRRSYKRVSLAVQKENYAVKMYKNVGFAIVDENPQEYIMVRRL